MPNSRFYSSTAAVTTLQVTANPSDVSIQVASSSGFPGSFPFTLALDYGSANEELVDVTSGGPSVFNVTRSVDGTSASTHNAGAVVRHVSSARDFTDSRTHEASATGVHGVSGQIVDTLSVQSMANKTLTAPVINNPSIAGTVAGGATYSSVTLTTPTVTNPTVTGGGSLSGTFTGSPTLSGSVTMTGGLTLTGSSALVERTLTTDNAYRARITGDTNSRIIINADGAHIWGTGMAAGDTILTRSGVGNLTLTGGLTITGTLSPATMTGNVAGNPAFTGTPTFAPTTATDAAIIPDTVANGWSLNGAKGRKAAGVTTIRVNVERVGANIVASASGNIPDTVIGTLAAGWRPLDGTMITNYDMSGIATGSVSIGNDGIVTIKSLSAGNTIGLADTVNFSLTFVSAA